MDKNTYLQLQATNFGPISEASIDLKPLTIFIGPNNSGKSYLAKLISCYYYGLRKVPSTFAYAYLPGTIKDELTNLFNSPSPRSTEFVRRANRTFKRHFKDSLVATIEKAFGSETAKLSRLGSHESHLRFTSTKADFPFSLNKKNSGSLTLSDRLGGIIPGKQEEVSLEDWIASIKTDLESLTPEKLESLFIKFFKDLILGYSNSLGIASYYFPAERHALVELQSFLAPLFYTDNSPKVSELPLFFRELYFNVLNAGLKKGEFSIFADRMSDEIIEGRIIYDKITQNILYQKNGLLIPLFLASTTVSQMSSLLMVLRGLVKRGDLLIIEEPEAHLHPANQLILAKYLVRLIRSGVKLLITTHSDLLVDQVGAYLVAQGLDEKTRVKKLKFEQDQFITQDEIAVYSFKATPDKKGYKVKKVKASQNDGIDAKEYAKVAEDIHDQYVDIRLAKNAKK